MRYPATRILDLDGTIIEHRPPERWREGFVVLPGVHEALGRWWRAGEHIIIMTARPEALRDYTVNQLRQVNIYYHQLIMGVTSGVRHLYNDQKPYDGEPTAVAETLKRDEGFPSHAECRHPRKFLSPYVTVQDPLGQKMLCNLCHQVVEE